MPFLASASGSPTICHTFFSSVSSSTSVTVAPNLIGVARQFRNVDHVGARELVLELGDAALVERLRFLGGVIFSVLRQVAVRARVGDLLNDAGPLDLLAMLELGLRARHSRRRSLEFFPSSHLLLAGARNNLNDLQRRQAPFTFEIPSIRLVIQLRPRSPAKPESCERGPGKKVLSRPASPDAATVNLPALLVPPPGSHRPKGLQPRPPK